jgi:hypothetical protein
VEKALKQASIEQLMAETLSRLHDREAAEEHQRMMA